MDTLARLRARIGYLGDLHEVVGAMRSMAAVHVQQARAALPGIHAYTHTVDAALAHALALLDAPPAAPPGEPAGAHVLLVLGPEHGFAGALPGQLAQRATQAAREGETRICTVGTRTAAAMLELGLAIDWRAAMATNAAGVLGVARDATDAVYAALGERRVGRLSLLHARSAGGAVTTVQRRLLPFDAATCEVSTTPVAPLTNLTPAGLVEQLADEFVFAEVMRAVMESLAAENAARLAAMTSAVDAVEERLEALRETARRMRQEVITTELLDLVAGVEASTGTPV